MTVAALEYRLSTLGSLLGVVEALRSLAAAKQQKASALLPAAQTYADEAALALAALSPLPRDPADRAVLLLGPEGGFTGGLCGRLAASAPAGSRPLTVGLRLASALQARRCPLSAFLSFPGTADALPALAAALAGRLPDAAAVTVIHAIGHDITRTELPPLPVRAGRHDVLTQLPDADLAAAAGRQDRQARLLLALLQAHAAEQLARLATLTGARERIRDRVADLTIQLSTTRQDGISQEIADLWAGRRFVQAGHG